MTITIAEAIQRTVEHREVFHDEMLHIMRQIMGGELTPAQVAGFMIGLRVKKETIGEIAAAAQVMREFATKVPVKDPAEVIDIVGTGGDAAHTFNVSTTVAFVVAAAGAKVAKHGNRAVSSRSGSADVLESLGANLSLAPEQIAACVEKIGIGFMFAPAHHPAMKHAAPVRKELGVRTIFNILGPLTNPAGAKNQLLGVFHPDLVGSRCGCCTAWGRDTQWSCTGSKAWTRFRSPARPQSASSPMAKSASTRSIRRNSGWSCTTVARSR
jgi:anthranilate phosphoribosyltransferase